MIEVFWPTIFYHSNRRLFICISKLVSLEKRELNKNDFSHIAQVIQCFHFQPTTPPSRYIFSIRLEGVIQQNTRIQSSRFATMLVGA